MEWFSRKTAGTLAFASLCMVSQEFTIAPAHAMGQRDDGDDNMHIPPSYMSVPYDPMIAYWDEPAGTSQIGATAAVASQGHFGMGQTIGIIGALQLNDPAFAGRIVSSMPGFCCDAHDTLVARIAAGAPGGVAPWSMIVSTNTVRHAIDAGATVTNESYGGSLNADNANYAASRGVTVVIAAGNDNRTYFPSADGGQYNFTPDAIKHLIIVGAVDSANVKQGISNIPGNNFLGTTPGGPVTGMKAVWLMAPASYTSYAAPEVTGAIALIQARWPILARNGMSTAVLFASAQDLGAPGVDEIYGNGLLRVDLAFQPIGGLGMQAIGGMLPIDILLNNMRSLQSSGALGSMPSLADHFRHFTAFDSFHRDFTVDLLSMIGTPSSSASLALAAMAPPPTVSSVHLADGSNLAFGNQDNVGNGIDHPLGKDGTASWFVMFTDASGSTVAAGSGFPVSASFAESLWGNGGMVSSQSSSLGVANALTNLASGGQFAALGTPLSKNTRLAVAWSQTPLSDPIANNGWVEPDAHAFAAGISTQMTKGWKAGVTVGLLDEQGGLLGATYDTSGPLNFGSQHRSLSFGLSSGLDLDEKTSLLLEAAISRSDSATMSNSLITDVSPLYARSVGASLVRRDAIEDGDQLQLSLKAPLKVISGSAGLAVTSVDADGYATTAVQRVGLKPNGNELRLGAVYQAPAADNLDWNLSLEGRHDVDNIARNSEVVGRIGVKLTF